MRLALYAAALAWLAGAALGQWDQSAKYEAVFFYYGYSHDYWVSPGNTTVGSRKCRRKKRCSFPEFMKHNTKDAGGFDVDSEYDLQNDKDYRIGKAGDLARGLARNGLTSAIEWDTSKLVIDAPAGKKVHRDHVAYVVNMLQGDAGKEGHAPHLAALAMDALRHWQDVAAHEDLRDVRDLLRAAATQDGVGLDLRAAELQVAVGDAGSAAAVGGADDVRTAIDMVAILTRWGRDIPTGIAERWEVDRHKAHMSYYAGLFQHQVRCAMNGKGWVWPDGGPS